MFTYAEVGMVLQILQGLLGPHPCKSRMVQGFFDRNTPGPQLSLAQTTCPEAQAPVRRSRGPIRGCPCCRRHPGCLVLKTKRHDSQAAGDAAWDAGVQLSAKRSFVMRCNARTLKARSKVLSDTAAAPVTAGRAAACQFPTGR